MSRADIDAFFVSVKELMAVLDETDKRGHLSIIARVKRKAVAELLPDAEAAFNALELECNLTKEI